MTALALLSDYKMKKKLKSKHPISESEIPFDLKTLREFRGEIVSHLSSHDESFKEIDARFDRVDARFDEVDARFKQVDARFDEVDARFKQVDARFDEVDARFKQVDARFDEVDARFKQVDARFDEMQAYIKSEMDEVKASIHRLALLMEEQNLRNRQAYDGYIFAIDKVNALENKIKPECFKE